MRLSCDLLKFAVSVPMMSGRRPRGINLGDLRLSQDKGRCEIGAHDKTGLRVSAQVLENAAKSIASNQPKNRCVLVVESDPDLQWQLARMLTVDGNRVVGAGSPEGAMAVIEHWPADLVLIAEDLPRMSGLELAQRIRNSNPRVLVILMAEANQEVEDERTSSPHITASLVKPFRFEALRSLIESLQLTPAPAG